MNCIVIRERGYVLDGGGERIFSRYVDPGYEHRDPATAQALWLLSGTDESEVLGIRVFRNGPSIVEDVRANKEYGDLHIVELIVDRVYFVTDEQLPLIQLKALERALSTVLSVFGCDERWEAIDLIRGHEQDFADLDRWRRCLAWIQEITSFTRVDAAEARAFWWAQGHLVDGRCFAEDYARYIDDITEPRDPDLPLLTPEEYAEEHAGEWETVDNAVGVVPARGGNR